MRETLSMLVHLARKDWRRIQLLAVLCWLLMASNWLILGYPARWGSRLSPMHAMLAVALTMLPLTHLVQLDSPLGSSGFWLTKPIHRLLALLAKLVVGALGLILPCLVVFFAPLAFLGLGIPAAQWADMLTGHLLVLAAVAAAALLAAAFTRSVGMAAGVLSSTLAALLLASTLLPERSGPRLSLAAGLSCATALTLGFLCVSGAVASVLFATRRALLAWAALALGIGGLYAGYYQWRPSFVFPPMQAALQENADLSGVRGEVFAKDVVELGKGEKTALRLGVRMAGVPEGIAMLPMGYAVDATMPGGKQVHAQEGLGTSGWLPQDNPRYVNPGVRYGDCPAVKAIADPARRGEPLEVWISPATGFDAAGVQRVSGVLRLWAVRIWLHGRAPAPLSRSERLTSPGLRVTAFPAEDGIHLRSEQASTMIQLQPRGPMVTAWLYDTVRQGCEAGVSASRTDPSLLPYHRPEWVVSDASPTTEIWLASEAGAGSMDVSFDIPVPPDIPVVSATRVLREGRSLSVARVRG